MNPLNIPWPQFLYIPRLWKCMNPLPFFHLPDTSQHIVVWLRLQNSLEIALQDVIQHLLIAKYSRWLSGFTSLLTMCDPFCWRHTLSLPTAVSVLVFLPLAAAFQLQHPLLIS